MTVHPVGASNRDLDMSVTLELFVMLVSDASVLTFEASTCWSSVSNDCKKAGVKSLSVRQTPGRELLKRDFMSRSSEVEPNVSVSCARFSYMREMRATIKLITSLHHISATL